MTQNKNVATNTVRAIGDTDRYLLEDSICSLIGHAREGCENARSEVLAQLRSYLKIVASSQMNDKFQSKFGESDVVQQSIAVAIERFDYFRGRSKGELFAWAKRILRNEILQQQRALLSDKRNMFREQQLEAFNKSTCRQQGLADTNLTPNTNAIRQEQSEAISDAISRLPKDYQEIIQARNFDQLSFAEIGERMGKSENAVTKLWFRALVQLRKEFKVNDV